MVHSSNDVVRVAGGTLIEMNILAEMRRQARDLSQRHVGYVTAIRCASPGYLTRETLPYYIVEVNITLRPQLCKTPGFIPSEQVGKPYQLCGEFGQIERFILLDTNPEIDGVRVLGQGQVHHIFVYEK